MPQFIFPNSASLHTAKAFFEGHKPFDTDGRPAILRFHPAWAHLEPFALSMAAAWGTWCRRNHMEIKVENLGRRADYAARMRLFQYLGVKYDPKVVEHEEAGRFVPITQVKDRTSITAVIGDISALLHLNQEPDALAAVQYCVSELLRNVLEHSGSEDGAFVCAHRYTTGEPHRITLAVADCGMGISKHLSANYPDASGNDRIAIGLAMRPGITGARLGLYGTPENAGAGLFITRCIAKGTGGYFFISSGNAAYRLRRSNDPESKTDLYIDPYDEPRYDLWEFPSAWKGTVVSVEIRTEQIEDFQDFFVWIREHLPQRMSGERRIRFT